LMLNARGIQSRIARATKANPASIDDLRQWDLYTEFGILNRGQFEETSQAIKALKIDDTSRIGKFRKEFPESPKTALGNAARRILGKDPLPVDKNHINLLWGRGYGNFIENNARIAHFEWALGKGLTPFEAARSTNRYLFDYTKLTQFEQQYMRPTFLFYTWMRNNIPLMAQTAVQKPRFATAYAKLIGADKEDVPQYLKGGTGIRVNKELVLGSLGLPIEDLNTLNIQDSDPLFFAQLKRLGQRIVSNTSPVPKAIFEILSGETSFSRRPLDSLSALELVKNFLPISRFVRTGEKIIDPEGDEFLPKTLDFFTGIRTHHSGEGRAAIDSARRKLLATGKFTKFPILTPKKRFKEDEDVKALQAMLRKTIKDNPRKKP